MYISKQTDYAMYLMAALAQQKDGDDPLSLSGFAEDEELSFFFLQRIARKLRTAGLVRGVEGRNGGYCLKRPASEITVGEIIRAMEGVLRVTDCATEGIDKACPRHDRCRVQRTWCELKLHIAAFYDQLTLSDILTGEHKPITL
jgi:Rrf2 family protein